jgi:hypothetical protein
MTAFLVILGLLCAMASFAAGYLWGLHHGHEAGIETGQLIERRNTVLAIHRKLARHIEGHWSGHLNSHN